MIVVTGAAGFIGSVLAARLNALGDDALLLVDVDAKGARKWENLKKRRFTDYLEAEDFLTRLEKGEFADKLAAIFHLGACSDTTEMDKDYLRRNNTEYTKKLAAWCLSHDVYFCYASSAATYGSGENGFSDADELAPRLKPLNPYGQSKLDFDRWAIKSGLQNKMVGLRYFNVYGPNEYHKGHMRSMAHKGFEQVQKEGKLRLFKSYKKEYSDGGQLRDFIYVKDAVEAMIWLYQNPTVKGIFNLGTGKAQSWNEMASAIFKALGKKENIEYIDMPENLKEQYQYFTEADMSKLRAAGCPIVFRALDQGVKDYIQNHLLKTDPYL